MHWEVPFWIICFSDRGVFEVKVAMVRPLSEGREVDMHQHAKDWINREMQDAALRDFSHVARIYIATIHTRMSTYME